MVNKNILEMVAELGEAGLNNVRKRPVYTPPRPSDLTPRIPSEVPSIPVRPSGAESRELPRNVIDMINVSSTVRDSATGYDYSRPFRLGEERPKLDILTGHGDPAEFAGSANRHYENYLNTQSRLHQEARPINLAQEYKGSYDQSEVIGSTFEQQRAFDYYLEGGSQGSSRTVSDVNLPGRERIIDPRDADYNDYADVTLLSRDTDYGQEYARQQEALRISRFGEDPPASISDLFQTQAARDFQYRSGTQGMEAPGFRLTSEQQARVEAIESGDYLNLAARNVRAVENARTDLPAMVNQEALDEVYSEVAHTRANLNTATEAMEGVTTGTPVASGGTGTFTTTPTQSSSFLGGMDPSTGRGIAMGVGMGALLGGTANYAMGGEFSEGAMMGGLAGGGIMIGARAIGANQNQISNYMQRQVLGDAFVEGADNAASVRALSDETVSRLGFGQRQAYNQLMRGADTPRMQARHAVIGGSMLAGVAFTGRRNDKRRGFNAHRGNRI